MNTDKIYTINDFILNIVNYGRMIGYMVAFPNIDISEPELSIALKKREDGLKFLKDTYIDIKFYIDNDIFTIGKIIDVMYDSSIDALPTIYNIDWNKSNISIEDVKEHIDLMRQTSYIIISMIISIIVTDDKYPENDILKFISLDE